MTEEDNVSNKSQKREMRPGEHCTWALIHFSPNKETRPSFFLSHTNTHTQQPLNSLLDVALILSATIINKQINHLDGICVRGPSGLCENE